MGFVSYSHLILQISDQTLQVNVARKIFWKLNGLWKMDTVCFTVGMSTADSLRLKQVLCLPEEEKTIYICWHTGGNIVISHLFYFCLE